MKTLHLKNLNNLILLYSLTLLVLIIEFGINTNLSQALQQEKPVVDIVVEK